MPRVHGVDIAPRRRRGRGHPRPSVAHGGAGAGHVGAAAGVDGDSVNNFEVVEEKGDTSSSNALEDIHGDNLHISLGDGVMSGRKSNGRGASANNGAASPTAPSESQETILVSNKAAAEASALRTPKESIAPTAKASESVNTKSSIGSSTKSMTSNGTNIQPQGRESLDHLEFGSNSFSVQVISHKSPQTSTSNNNHLAFNSMGLAPSLETIAATSPSASETAQSMPHKDDAKMHPSIETDALAKAEGKEKNSESQKPPDEANLASQTAQLMSTEQAEKWDQCTERTNGSGDSSEDSNAHWLYQRCATACAKMESHLTAFELAIKTLQEIRSVPADDDFVDNLQQKLFSFKDGKRKDVDFTFEVAEKGLDLREDELLNENSLREIVPVDDIAMFDLDNRQNDESPRGGIRQDPKELSHLLGVSTPRVTQHGQQHTITHSMTDGDSTQIIHRSRRKKRDKRQNHNNVADSATHQRGMALLQTCDSTRVNENGLNTNNPVIEEDSLDMQDDGWSFLPSAPLQTENDVADMTTQRVTRSMGLPVEDANSKTAEQKREKSNINHNKSTKITGEKNAVTEDDAYLVTTDEGGDNATHDSKVEEPGKMIRKADTCENSAQSNPEQSDTVDDKARAVDDTSRCSKKHSVESIAQSMIDLSGEKPSRRNEKRDDDQTNAKENTPPSGLAGSPGDQKEIYTVVKARQRGECKDTVRILFTGINPLQRHMQMIETIGAEVIDSIKEAHTATHVIAKDDETQLRRTPKLLISICRVSRILSMEWLEQSAKEQRALDTDDFILIDKEAEKKYNFSMKETIRNGSLARRKRGGVLGGWFCYICSGVAGNNAPNMKELQLIIDAAGGQVVRSLKNPGAFNPRKTIVLTSEPSTKSQLNERGVSRVQCLGAKVLSTAWLFHTIMTQNLFDIDVEECDVVSGLVKCNTHQSLTVLPPVRKRGTGRDARHVGNLADQVENVNHIENSVRSSSTQCSKESRAPIPPSISPKLQKRKLDFEQVQPTSSQKCGRPTTREQFISSHLSLLSSFEALLEGEDKAVPRTHRLWLDYFKGVSTVFESHRTKPSPSNASKSAKRRGVRCLRGRRRSISPLISSTTLGGTFVATSAKKGNQKSSLTANTRKVSILKDNSYVTWEAYVLFTLSHRSEKLGYQESLTSDAIVPTSCYFPCPLSINKSRVEGINEGNGTSQSKKLSLSVGAIEDVHNYQTNEQALEIFGSLQSVFSLYHQHQSGMISEAVIARFALQAIEAVSAMHACGVIHNDIGMDSFLVVRRVAPVSGKKKQRKKAENDHGWFLQLVGFGYKSVVLNNPSNLISQEAQFEHDFHCLANVIHQLISGGVNISLNTSPGGSVEFTSKAFIKGNLYLRAALSWCSLIDALMCVGEVAPASEGSIPFMLQHPVEILNFATPDSEENSRLHQFSWSCRLLQELSENSNLAIFLDGLRPYNPRYVQDTNLSTFACSVHGGRQSFDQAFVCCTSNEHFVQKESKLEADALTLAQCKMEFQAKVSRYEQSQEDYQLILERESKVQRKEKDLLQREQTHALKVHQLERMEEELRLREARLEQRLRYLKHAPNVSSPTRPLLQNDINADRLPRSGGNSKLETPISTENVRGCKRKNASANLPTPSHSKLSARVETPKESKTRRSANEDSLKQNERVENMNVNFGSESSTSSKNYIRQKQKMDQDLKASPMGPLMRHKQKTSRDLKSPTMGHYNVENMTQSGDLHGESQECHDSTSSSKKRKRESRKSPKCSLHNLPKSSSKMQGSAPKMKSGSSHISPRPKKVLITFIDD